ncbi:unnamed protein product [Ectocarpus sp. 4 AP-2014]
MCCIDPQSRAGERWNHMREVCMHSGAAFRRFHLRVPVSFYGSLFLGASSGRQSCVDPSLVTQCVCEPPAAPLPCRPLSCTESPRSSAPCLTWYQVSNSPKRQSLGDFKDEITKALKLDEEEDNAVTSFFRKGFKNKTWWEEGGEEEKSTNWRS